MKLRAEPSFIVTIATLLLTNEPKYVIFMLFSAFVHEVGHIVAMKVCGVKINTLVLGFFGGTVIMEKKLISYGKEAFIAFSGPFVNLIFSTLFFIIMRSGFSADIFFLFLCNIFYGVFNLLPIGTLDGGAVLKSLLARKKELYTVDRTMNILSRITLFLLGTFSIFLVSMSAFNISLLAVTLLFYAESTEGHIISGYEFCRRTS